MSTLVVSNISDGTSTIGITSTAKTSARAYIRVTTSGVIYESYNISGVTVGSNGNVFTCTFTNSMPDIEYAVMATVNTTTGEGSCFVRGFTNNSFQVVVRDYDGGVGNAGVSAVVYSESA